MLKLKVYMEKLYRGNGIGEDAYPFVNEAGMFVADGLGGSAGIPIVSFAKECFNPAKLTELISERFEVPEEMQGALEEYITLNFASLSNAKVEQVYTAAQTEERFLRKKSGYVGSHALGVALALELMGLQEGKLAYDDWRHTFIDTQSGKNILSDETFPLYNELINIMKAEKAHTALALSSLALFGTTLAGCFFWEEKDEVVGCFFNCGDSRSYVWEKEGYFRQAVDDQGRDGRVGALYAYGDKAPEVQVTFKRYAKPCTIISMTDGVYKAYGGQEHFDSSPLYMELRLLDSLACANTEAEAENLIKEQLRSAPDDSASCAIAAFGYTNYSELKSAANKRLEALLEHYELEQFIRERRLTEFLTAKYLSDEKEEKLRSRVFAKYLAEHLSDVSPEKRADVKKNGWSEA